MYGYNDQQHLNKDGGDSPHLRQKGASQPAFEAHAHGRTLQGVSKRGKHAKYESRTAEAQ